MDELGANRFSASTSHGQLHLCLGLWGQRKGKKVCTSALLASEKHPKLQVWSARPLDVTVLHPSAVFSEDCVSFTSNCEHCSPTHTYSVSPASKTKTSNVANNSLDATTFMTHISTPSLHTWNISGFRHLAGRPASLERSTGQILTEILLARNFSTSRMVLPSRADKNLSSGLDRTSTPFREKDQRSATNVASSFLMGSAF